MEAGRSAARAAGAFAALVVLGAACGAVTRARVGPAGSPDRAAEVLRIGAIPDQDPEKLQRLHGRLAGYLGQAAGVAVEYRPVTDYAAAVTLFRSGDLDLVWFGGLTGVQARLQVPGARAILQRDIDENFHSVFIVNASTGLQPATGVGDLAKLKRLTFTFGSESSTSGRLMPQHFLEQAGVSLEDFAAAPGYSGSHDRTIELVKSGSFQAGVLNEQVWAARTGEAPQDPARLFFRTPGYHDYHWVVRPDVDGRLGPGATERIEQALLGLDEGDPAHKEILDLFGARKFIPTTGSNYSQIEAVARRAGLIG